MTDFKLRVEVLTTALERQHLSQSDLAGKLDVSRQVVSSWINQNITPRRDKLAKLCATLAVPFAELVERIDGPNAPVVAFRAKRNRKTTDAHLDKARAMGYALEKLAPYSGFAPFRPPTLMKVDTRYDYVQEIAQEIRAECRPDNAPLKFEDLVERFSRLRTVIIPVFRGDIEKHENALRVFLPESQTSWVYLNLDSNIYDFKFWMAHELGHILTPETPDDNAERFADAFAQSLLFPKPLAENAYLTLRETPDPKRKIQSVLALAQTRLVAPYTIRKAIEAYAASEGLENIDFPEGFPGAETNFKKAAPSVTKMLFGDETPDARRYVDTCGSIFKTPFFSALSAYLRVAEDAVSYLRRVMDISLIDAINLARELKNAPNEINS